MTASNFAITKLPSPLLNTPDFPTSFGNPPLDSQGLLRAVETVLLPGTKLRIHKNTCYPHIVEVSSNEYPYAGPFFTDLRLLTLTDGEPEERIIPIPSMEKIFSRLDGSMGAPYIWGGNWIEGIPDLLTYYPSTSDSLDIKMLRGCDCTGLLYEATGGLTPRNTSTFVSWGQAVPIADCTLDQLRSLLQPLDAIVWRGHLVLVYDRATCIESRVGKGVVKTEMKERLEEILRDRTPADTIGEKNFVVRRWFTLTDGIRQ